MLNWVYIYILYYIINILYYIINIILYNIYIGSFIVLQYKTGKYSLCSTEENLCLY